MKKTQATGNRNLEHFQRALSDRLDALEKRVGTDNYSYHSGTERLFIHLAFDRIRKGEYWLCVKCGEEIAEEMMLVDPTTLTCAGCESGPKKSTRGVDL